MRAFLVFYLFFVSFIYGQGIPQGFNHRGVIVDNQDKPVVNKFVTVRATIFDNEKDELFIETHNVLTNSTGHYSIVIGQGERKYPNYENFKLSDLNWGDETKTKSYKIEIDITGRGNNFSISGISQFFSVPYALFSLNKTNTESNSCCDSKLTTLNTINDLKLFTAFDWDLPSSNNFIVYVKGYYDPGDGGGGHFIFKRKEQVDDESKFPLPDEGVFIQSWHTGIADVGIWVRQLGDKIDVRYYGVRDGGNDETERFQKALDYAHNSTMDLSVRKYWHSSNTVYVPNGTFGIKQLYINSGVNLKGSSSKNCILISRNEISGSSMFCQDFRIQGSRLIREINISDLTIYGNSLEYENNGFNPNSMKIQHCFYFDFTESGGGGIWNSTFKNLQIQFFTGHSLHFGAGNSTGHNSVNQFNIFENVHVESVGQLNKYNDQFRNTYHALSLYGACNQFLFNNCRFNGGSYLYGNNGVQQYKVNGISVVIHNHVLNNAVAPGIIKFNLCTIENAEKGVYIQSSNNISFDTCWFEFFEFAFSIYGNDRISKSISIVNSSFLNSSGRHGFFTNSSGNIVTFKNAKIKFENNYIINSGPFPNDLDFGTSEEYFFARYDYGDNLNSGSHGFNSSDNFFEDYNGNRDLSKTFGLKTDILIDTFDDNWNELNINGLKTMYLKNTTSNIKPINRINSFLSAGEIIFIKADQGPIQFQNTDNIYLGKSVDFLNLDNGGVAIFIKVDEITYKNGQTYYDTYQLISSKND